MKMNRTHRNPPIITRKGMRMGQLVDGKWDGSDERPTDRNGAFIRASSAFRNWITPDGTAGISGDDGFSAEPGRYHLFVAPSCPWAHRAVIYRKLKGLESVISISHADAPKSEGWSYTEGYDDMKPRDDGIFRLHQVYTSANPAYTGKVTVPALWDRERKTIVNNESSEIIRMFNSAFDQLGANSTDYCPADLHAEIDEVNASFTTTSTTASIVPVSPRRRPRMKKRLPRCL